MPSRGYQSKRQLWRASSPIIVQINFITTYGAEFGPGSSRATKATLPEFAVQFVLMIRHPLLIKKPLAQLASPPLVWLVFLLAAMVLLTTVGPSEKTLGERVRIVYLHGAWVWTSLAAFVIAGMAGLAGIIARKPTIHQWSRAWGWTGLLFWVSYLPVSIWAMETSWNGLYLSEPRWRLALIFAVTGLLLQSGLALLDKPAWTSTANLLFIAILLLTLANTRNIMHPPTPVLSSDSLLIRGYFFGLLAIMFLAAWQVAHLWHKGDLAQAGNVG